MKWSMKNDMLYVAELQSEMIGLPGGTSKGIVQDSGGL